MVFKKHVLILFFVIIASSSLFAQQDSIPLATIVSKTEKLSAEHPFEKVYLHFDKPYYAVGDTIWFKAYLTIGSLHQPSALSKIIYVDVISDRDTVIQTLKLPVINSIAFGDINLTKLTYKQGNYHIRAYTNWMRNFDAEYFFNKEISVGDAADNAFIASGSFKKAKRNNDTYVIARLTYKDHNGNPVADKRVSYTVQTENESVVTGKGVTDKNGVLIFNFLGNKLTDANTPSLIASVDQANKKPVVNKFSLKSVFATTDLQFFPEGGNLISGVRSKVAFKAVGADGLGVNISGSVVDNSGTEVATFTSTHGGMGIFPLQPENDKTYKAIVTLPDGSKNTYDLPSIMNDGINIAVNNNDPDNLTIKVATNPLFFKRYQNKGFYIIAQSGGVIYYTGLAALQSLVYTGDIPKSKFPTGVLQVTLLAADGDPLSERLVFIQHNDALNMSVSTDLPSYNARQKVNMTLLAKNKVTPVQGSFSVAVVDDTTTPFDEDAENTILSNILLTSDLRGYIEKPNYYFNKVDDTKLADLDVLMLTQGYRRFSYSNILAGKYPLTKFSAEKAIVVSGTLRTTAGVPVFKGVVNLKVPDRHISVNGYTDADGRFSFSNVSIFDSSKVIISARNNDKANNMMLAVDLVAAQPIVKNYSTPDEIANIDSALNTYLENSKKQLQNNNVLNEVVIKSTRIVQEEHPVYKNLIGLSTIPDQDISTARINNCGFDLVGCLTNVVAGIMLVDDKFYIQKHYYAGSRRAIQFFVNGSEITNTELVAMKSDDVKSIEVFFKDGPGQLNSFYRSDGIISITTKSGSFAPVDKDADLSPLTVSNNEITITPKGFYRARIFYSPKYDNPAAARALDLRSTIYWNPAIFTDEKGTATFDFYNADGRGTYRAIVEGIDNDGNIGRFVLHYTVK